MAMDEYGNEFANERVIDDTQHNFTLEFVDNGAIITYEDGMRCVVQGDDKEVFAFIGKDLNGAISNMTRDALNYDIEITIKAKE